MTELTDVHGVGPAMALALAERGMPNVEDLAAARPGDLLAVPRIGATSAPRIIAAAKAMVKAAGAVSEPPKKEKTVKADKKKKSKSGKSKDSKKSKDKKLKALKSKGKKSRDKKKADKSKSSKKGKKAKKSKKGKKK